MSSPHSFVINGVNSQDIFCRDPPVGSLNYLNSTGVILSFLLSTRSLLPELPFLLFLSFSSSTVFLLFDTTFVASLLSFITLVFF